MKRMAALGTVAELWRYPVKSMRGERLSSLLLDSSGISGDRRFAIESSGAPAGKPLLTGRERSHILLCIATGTDANTLITTPDGQRLRLADPATLPTLGHALGTANSLRLVRASRPLTDCRPVSILSLQALRQLEAQFGKPIDPRRFRANLLLDLTSSASQIRNAGKTTNALLLDESFQSGTAPEQAAPHAPSLLRATATPEEHLVGKRIRIGDTAVLSITERDPRCRIVILDPETAEPDPSLMKLIDRLHGGRIGVYATVHTPGPLQAGDTVSLA